MFLPGKLRKKNKSVGNFQLWNKINILQAVRHNHIVPFDFTSYTIGYFSMPILSLHKEVCFKALMKNRILFLPFFFSFERNEVFFCGQPYFLFLLKTGLEFRTAFKLFRCMQTIIRLSSPFQNDLKQCYLSPFPYLQMIFPVLVLSNKGVIQFLKDCMQGIELTLYLIINTRQGFVEGI